jgi:chromosome segregation ATPase
MSKIRLEDLLSRCTPENRHEEVNFDSPSVTDLIANLANRVHSLEQQLRDTQGNLEKLAEELANTKHRVSKHTTMFGAVEERVGMLTDDIITLDERSQVLNAINKFYEEGSR